MDRITPTLAYSQALGSGEFAATLAKLFQANRIRHLNKTWTSWLYSSWCMVDFKAAGANVLQSEGHQTLSFNLPRHGQDQTPRDRVTVKADA